MGISFGTQISAAEISQNILNQAGLPDGPEPVLPAIFEELRSAGLLQKVKPWYPESSSK
jgi:hypothetical protein